MTCDSDSEDLSVSVILKVVLRCTSSGNLTAVQILWAPKPRMKKLSYSQGKLLIKLINRECNSTSYELVKAFMGPIRAGFWQAFAWVFGASLKKGYDADGTDRMTERVVLMVESGQL